MDPILFEEEEIYESDDGDEMYLLENILPMFSGTRACNIDNFHLLLQECNDETFQSHLRVSKNLATSLVQKYESSRFFVAYRTITSWRQVIIFLWFVSHEACGFRDIANRYNISLSHLHKVLNNMSRFVSSLAEEYITWPSSQDELNANAALFYQKAQFPGVIGCIDGSHINIDKPSDQHVDYFDRKKNYSFKIQAICNAQKEFIDIFIGVPGSVHDARMLRMSPILDKINNLPTGFRILGDSAYPLSEHLVTPYRDNGHLVETQTNFNYRHSSTRVCIEHTFGILKQRFRCLYHLKLRKLEDMVYVAKACIVLHNMCAKFSLTEDNFDMQGHQDEDEEPLEFEDNDHIRNNIF